MTDHDEDPDDGRAILVTHYSPPRWTHIITSPTPLCLLLLDYYDSVCIFLTEQTCGYECIIFVISLGCHSDAGGGRGNALSTRPENGSVRYAHTLEDGGPYVSVQRSHNGLETLLREEPGGSVWLGI
jgi:hypothetical protein